MQTLVLGPFVGHITETSVRLWVHWPIAEKESHSVTFSISKSEGGEPVAKKTVVATRTALFTALCEFENLDLDTAYFYSVTNEAGESVLSGSEDLSPKDLKVRTLKRDESLDLRTDFLLLSCHNPEAGKTKTGRADGFEVWAEIPKILKENPDVRFAILGGDQVYLDDAAETHMKKDEEQKREKILEYYRKHWGNKHYRKVLCSLPSYLIWDDHDIVDGWGSELSSFVGTTSEFKPEWKAWFQSAKTAFWHMQASRNHDVFGRGSDGPFDTCFRVGNSAFVLADLRSNRNMRLKQIWLPEQFERIKDWVSKQEKLEALFFVTPVVFAHGDPKAEDFTSKIWESVLKFIDCLRSIKSLASTVKKWDKSVGDLRDDLADGWFSEVNAKSASEVLNYLFNLQNADKDDVAVVILSGDIHTSGFSNIYSDDPKHGRFAVIPHIVSSPVAYGPFHWLGEAFYRSRTKTTRLAEGSPYKAQISHHYPFRCATVVSLRVQSNGTRHLKVKYYLEGFEEPNTVVFDLDSKSHRERLAWQESGESEATA